VSAPSYTGFIKRLDDGTLEGWIEDSWGWKIHLSGAPDRERSGFALSGALGPTPAALQMPGEDAMRQPLGEPE
jgi:hypothetical protein